MVVFAVVVVAVGSIGAGGFAAHAREATGEEGGIATVNIDAMVRASTDLGEAYLSAKVLGGGGEDMGEGGIIGLAFVVASGAGIVIVAVEVGAGASRAGGGDDGAGGVRDAVIGSIVQEIAAASHENIGGTVASAGGAGLATIGAKDLGADEVEVVGGGEVGFDVDGVAAVLVGLDDELEVIVVGSLSAKEEGIGEDLVGAGIGGFGEGGEAEEGLLEVGAWVGVVAGVADIVGIHIAGGAKAEVGMGIVEAVIAAEGVIDDGGVVAFVDYMAGVASVEISIGAVYISAGEVEEIAEEVVIGFGGCGGGVGCGVEAEEVAMEVVVANNGTLVVGAVVRVGEEHLGEIVIASATGGRAGADAAIGADGEVVANAVVGAVAEEIQAEDVIGDGGGDGGIDFAIGLHIAKSGAGEELGFKEGEGGDYFFEAIAGDGASSGVSGELVDEVKIDVSEVARGVIEGGPGVGGAIAAVVQIVEGSVHFEELGGVGGEGVESAAGVDVDEYRTGVDADGEDEAILVDGGEGGGAGVLGGSVSVVEVWIHI